MCLYLGLVAGWLAAADAKVRVHRKKSHYGRIKRLRDMRSGVHRSEGGGGGSSKSSSSTPSDEESSTSRWLKIKPKTADECPAFTIKNSCTFSEAETRASAELYQKQGSQETIRRQYAKIRKSSTGKPPAIKIPILPDGLGCIPVASEPASPGCFARHASCSTEYIGAQIDDNLGVWWNGSIPQGLLKHGIKSDLATAALQIIDNKLYFVDPKGYGNEQGPRAAFFRLEQVVQLLLVVMQSVKLPDTELSFMGLDKPKAMLHEPDPVFGYSASSIHNAILLPVDETFQDSNKLKNEGELTWEKWQAKKSQLIWRGSPNGFSFFPYNIDFAPRVKLKRLSSQHPNELDVDFSTPGWERSGEDGLRMAQQAIGVTDESLHLKKGAPEGERFNAIRGHLDKNSVSMPDQSKKWKYLIAVDGTSTTYRLSRLLSSPNLVFWVTSPYFGYFYKHFGFEPHKHYIPVRYDMSDLVEKVRWAQRHDKEAFEIAKAGHIHARRVFQRSEMVCYVALLIESYSSLLGFRPTLHPDAIEMTVDYDIAKKCCAE